MDAFLRVRNERHGKLARGVGILVNGCFITQHTIRDFNMGLWTFFFLGCAPVRIPSTPFSSPLTAMPSYIMLVPRLTHSPNGIPEEACPG